tara:strand:- start:59 stop:547 length:489 start_codon:yes stop_codon:yes gene_type:complete
MKLLKKLLSNLLLGSLFVSFIVVFVVFKNWQTDISSTPIDAATSLMHQTKTHSQNKIIQIEVLNGCGDKGIADLYATYLRKNNFDVIDYKNADSFDYNSSKIIVHNNNLYVENVADLFKIDSKNIDYFLDDDNIIHDMTLIVGKDYKSLSSYNNIRKSYPPY